MMTDEEVVQMLRNCDESRRLPYPEGNPCGVCPGYQMYGVQCDGVACLDVADRLERLLKENAEKDAIIAKLKREHSFPAVKF